MRFHISVAVEVGAYLRRAVQPENRGIQIQVDLSDYDNAIQVEALFPRNGKSRNYRYTQSELREDGREGFRRWLQDVAVDLNLVDMATAVDYGSLESTVVAVQTGRPLPLTETLQFMGGLTWDQGYIDQLLAISGAGALPLDPLSNTADEISARAMGGWAYGLIKQTQHDAAADAKAQALFRRVAGEEAYQLLHSGKSLPLKGSRGTKYLLSKRMTYCVTRVKDGAVFCAVINNVPLWDHLLGIKLMVERDEPRFLEIANRMGGVPDRLTGFSLLRNWMPTW